MDDFKINDSNIDNLLPNEAGSSAFGDYDEDQHLDEDVKEAQEERHMIRSSRGPLLDNVSQWLDDKSKELDQNSTVRQIYFGYELNKHPSGHGFEIASQAAEIARKLFVDKANELEGLINVHLGDSER